MDVSSIYPMSNTIFLEFSVHLSDALTEEGQMHLQDNTLEFRYFACLWFELCNSS